MSLLSRDTIKNVAEAHGIANLKDDVAAALAQDVEYRIHEIVQEAVKFMHHSKRSKLIVDDINQALRVRNVEPLYGFSSGEAQNFKRAMNASYDLFYVEDEEVDFETILNKPLPKVPVDITYTVHWLAIEGVQPAIPQNPTPSDAKADILSKRIKPHPNKSGASASATTPAEVDVKPLVKHVLSKELQMYFERITEAVLSDEERLRSQAFESLRQDPGLHQLLPYFVQFVSEKVTHNMKNLPILESMLNVIQSLLVNPHLFVEPYLHQLMPAILSCLVGKKICESPAEDHWSVRDFAARLVASICTRYGKDYHTLQPRITKTLLRAFLDPSKPLTTHYGAVVGLGSLGAEVVRVLVIPNVKAYSGLLEKDLGAEGTRKMEAQKVFEALMNVIRIFLDHEKSNQPAPNNDDMQGVEDVNAEATALLKNSLGGMFAEAVLKETKSKQLVQALINAC